jgi:DNA repair protein RadA
MRISYGEAVDRIKKAEIYSTGSKCIDAILGGGLREYLVYHFFGASGTGKTQLSMQSSLMVASRGLRVAYIDTEGKFRPERIEEIAKLRGTDAKAISMIEYFRAETFSSQKEALERITNEERFRNVRLVVIDTVTNNLSLEMPGKEMMFRRQTSLSYFLERVCKDAYISGRVYLLTNRVAVANYEVHVGGKILEYMVNRNIKLERVDSRIVVSDIEDEKSCTTEISSKGVE